jgi:hypothetical protein
MEFLVGSGLASLDQIGEWTNSEADKEERKKMEALQRLSGIVESLIAKAATRGVDPDCPPATLAESIDRLKRIAAKKRNSCRSSEGDPGRCNPPSTSAA